MLCKGRDSERFSELDREERRYTEKAGNRHARAQPYKRDRKKVDPNGYDDFGDDEAEDNFS